MAGSFDERWRSPMFYWNDINADRPRFIHYLRQGWNNELELIAVSTHLTSPDSGIRVSLDNPDAVSESMFKTFVCNVVQSVYFHRDNGEWDIKLNPEYQRIFDSSLDYERQEKLLAAYEEMESGK